jgi:hypothetical protein
MRGLWTLWGQCPKKEVHQFYNVLEFVIIKCAFRFYKMPFLSRNKKRNLGKGSKNLTCAERKEYCRNYSQLCRDDAKLKDGLGPDRPEVPSSVSESKRAGRPPKGEKALNEDELKDRMKKLNQARRKAASLSIIREKAARKRWDNSRDEVVAPSESTSDCELSMTASGRKKYLLKVKRVKAANVRWKKLVDAAQGAQSRSVSESSVDVNSSQNATPDGKEGSGDYAILGDTSGCRNKTMLSIFQMNKFFYIYRTS